VGKTPFSPSRRPSSVPFSFEQCAMNVQTVCVCVCVLSAKEKKQETRARWSFYTDSAHSLLFFFRSLGKQLVLKKKTNTTHHRTSIRLSVSTTPPPFSSLLHFFR
jgi:hypothetical protein